MRHLLIFGLCLLSFCCAAQVGIGTTSPNNKSILDLTSTSKGFLLPRMTGLQKSELGLSANDVGMMLYQTDIPQDPLPPTPKGVYYYDGAGWVSPTANGTTIGQTLRWDGLKWGATSNLFNQGGSIGIGTQNPNTQLQIHSQTIPTTRLQITNAGTGALNTDGLMLGLTLTNSYAHLVQNENRPLWFGTNALERMRIDSLGNIGINKTNPTATLDVNGTVKFGPSGSLIHNIIKSDMEVLIPALPAQGEAMVNIACPNTLENAAVFVSPGSTMAGLMIAYARVSVPGNVEVKFKNMDVGMAEPMPVMLHIAVIQ